MKKVIAEILRQTYLHLGGYFTLRITECYGDNRMIVSSSAFVYRLFGSCYVISTDKQEVLEIKKIENKLIGKPPFRGDVSGFYAGTLVV